MTTKLRNTKTGEIIYTSYNVNHTYYPWVIDIYNERFECLDTYEETQNFKEGEKLCGQQ